VSFISERDATEGLRPEDGALYVPEPTPIEETAEEEYERVMAETQHLERMASLGYAPPRPSKQELERRGR
jgi:hypothetical protein